MSWFARSGQRPRRRHRALPPRWRWWPRVVMAGRSFFPFSDVDLLFVTGTDAAETEAKPAIRLLGQQMWDVGNRFSPVTRAGGGSWIGWRATNLEFGLSLLDRRVLLPESEFASTLEERVFARLIEKDSRVLSKGLIDLTRQRHARYGNTLFHLEPNVKDCPGGLRDVNVCGWLAMLESYGGVKAPAPQDGLRGCGGLPYRPAVLPASASRARRQYAGLAGAG